LITSKRGTGVSVDSSGKIYVADVSNHRIQVFQQDREAPTGSISLSASYPEANNKTVTLKTPATDELSDVTQMIVSIKSDFSDTSWEGYSTTKSWTFPQDGSYTLYVKYKDTFATESEVYSTTVTVDTVKPVIQITDIGLISNVPNKDSLFYYFTSQDPHIKGTSDPNSTVTFKYGSKTYTATTNTEGIFEITIKDLPRERVELLYFATDQAGNKSGIKQLTLVIGIENFPTEVVSSGTDEGTQTGEQQDRIVPSIYDYEIMDKEGNLLSNTKVVIGGQEYMSDSDGKIYTEVSLLTGTQTDIYSDDGVLIGYVKGKKIVVGVIDNDTQEQPKSSVEGKEFNSLYICAILLLVLSTGGYYLREKFRSGSN